MNRIGHAASLARRILDDAPHRPTPAKPTLPRTGFSGTSGFMGAAQHHTRAKRAPHELNVVPQSQGLLVRGIATLVAGVTGTASAVWNGLQRAGQAIGNVFSNIGKAVSNAASNVGKAVSNVASNIARAVSTAASNVGKAVSNVASNVGNAVSNAWRSIFG